MPASWGMVTFPKGVELEFYWDELGLAFARLKTPEPIAVEEKEEE